MIRFAALILAMLAAGCAITRSSPDPENGARFLSLAPASLGRDLELSQRVTGDHGGKTYRARYEVELTGNRLVVVGLSPIGITLFTIVQQGSDITVDSALSKVLSIDPRYTLFDLYLTYWPPSVLAPALDKIGMTLDLTAKGKTRTVRDRDGRRVATITYAESSRGAIEIEHFDRPYRIRIFPLTSGKKT